MLYFHILAHGNNAFFLFWKVDRKVEVYPGYIDADFVRDQRRNSLNQTHSGG